MGQSVRHRYDDIVRLVARAAGRTCDERGWSLADLAHDVVLVALRYEGTASGWDPERGGLSTYVQRLTRSLVVKRLRHEYLEQQASAVTDAEPDGHHDEGLDDDARARLRVVLADASRVLRRGEAYRAVLSWLLDDREVLPLSRRSGITEHDLWRYLALILGRLSREAGAPWRSLWARHRAYAARRLRAWGTPPPLGTGGVGRGTGKVAPDLSRVFAPDRVRRGRSGA